MVLENANEIPQTGLPLQWWSQLFSISLSLMVLFQIGSRLYGPPSLLCEGFKARMCIASFTPLSNHLCPTGVPQRQYLHVLQRDGVVGTVCVYVF